MGDPDTRKKAARSGHGFFRFAAGLLFGLLGLFAISSSAWAQSWPSKPIRLIVVYPGGGVSDSVARLLAPRLSERLGVPVVVENKGGGGGSIGMDAMAKSNDAHTFGFAAVKIGRAHV